MAGPGDDVMKLIKYDYLFTRVLKMDHAGKALQYCSEQQKKWHDNHSQLPRHWRECKFKELVEFGNEGDRASEEQSEKHSRAYCHLERAAKSGSILSEELIQKVHSLLMKDLPLSYSEDAICDGKYRQEEMYDTGKYLCQNHQFVSFELVPEKMKFMVETYNKKFSNEHNTFELASWLLMRLLTIHPFQDGNGRVARLFWCYSLQRDGLPFPIRPFPEEERKKAYITYLKLVRKDFDHGTVRNTVTLTLASVTMMWKAIDREMEEQEDKRQLERRGDGKQPESREA